MDTAATTGKADDPKGDTKKTAGDNLAGASPRLKADYLKAKLDEAEVLLGYAAETGIEMDDAVRDGVLQARVAHDGGGFTEKAADDLLTALTALAHAKLPLFITHAPGAMLVTDLRNSELAGD